MAIVEFGNVSADMRLIDDAYGIPALQDFDAFLLGFVAVSEEILRDDDTGLIVRDYDAGGSFVTTTILGNLTSGQVSLISVEAAGVIETVSGNFTITVDAFGDALFYGTANEVRAEVVSGGGLLVRFGELTQYISSTGPDAEDESMLYGADGVSSGNGNDYLLGYAGDDQMSGGPGNDTLDGGSGTDTMAGGPGDDTYIVDSSGDVVTEAPAAGTDSVQSSASYAIGANIEKLTLTGTLGIAATGNGLANEITGNSGFNTLDGGAGADTLAGGAGNDVYYLDNASDVVLEQVDEGTDKVITGLGHVLGPNVENLEMTGGGAVNGTGNALANTIVGNSGANLLAGGSGNDMLFGGGGSDILDGGTGFDRMEGGAGNDTYIVNEAPPHSLALNGAQGDPISGGQSYVFSSTSGTFSVQSASDITNDGLVDFLSLNYQDSFHNWHLSFGTNALGQNLAPGIYLDAQRASFAAAGHPGLDIWGDGIGSNEIFGSFTIDNVQFDYSGLSPVLLNFSATFEQHSDSLAAPALTGAVSYNHPVPEPVIESLGEGVDTVYATVSYVLGANVENLRLAGTGSINGTGNELANVIWANPGANAINGMAGVDTVSYYYADGAVNASLLTGLVTGGSGADTLSNFENLYGSNSYGDTLVGNAVANVLTGYGGNDSLDGGAGTDTLVGGTGDDVYYVDVTGDVVTEGVGAGTDTVYAMASHVLSVNVDNLRLAGTGAINGTGNGLANVIWANSGVNVLNGMAGVDTVSYYYADGAVNASLLTGLVTGGSGADTLSNFENLYGSNSFGDTLVGNAGANLLSGYGGNDTLEGGEGIDSLDGGAGNDSLDGGSGSDTMIGGAGDDVYYVNSPGDVVIEGVNAGTDIVYSSTTHELAANVENLRMTGVEAYSGRGNGLANVIYANGGYGQFLDGAGGVDTVSYYYEDAAVNANLLTGRVTFAGSGPDFLVNIENLSGSNGYGDTLVGNAGVNVLTGFGGNDVYYADAADVVIEGVNAGTDTVYATASYVLSANVENLRLAGTGAINGTGNELANLIWANGGANALNGMAGVDTVSYYYAEAGVNASLLTGLVTGGSGADTLSNFENLYGSNSFGDTLVGNTDANLLTGYGGNDSLNGGAGNDQLTGGLGSDTFLFDTALNGTTNVDQIIDFSVADDTIQLENAIFGSLASGPLPAGQLRAAPGALSAVDADDFLIYNSSSGALYYDADGNGGTNAPVLFANLSAGLGLTALDFAII